MLTTNYTEKPVTLSVITATYNAAAHLPRLIDSLRQQTDQDFEWVVADGASTDDTLALLQAVTDLNIKITSQEDFGIYDALNRAIKTCNGEFYLVVGADDLLYPEAVQRYKAACNATTAVFVTARVESSHGIRGPNPRPWAWLYGQFAYVSSHAVGLAIRRSLHVRYGYYSRKYPTAADQLFILQVLRGGGQVNVQDFVAGRFDDRGGTSGQDVLGSLLEGFRVQVAVGYSLAGQGLLVMLRIVKNWRRIMQEKK